MEKWQKKIWDTFIESGEFNKIIYRPLRSKISVQPLPQNIRGKEAKCVILDEFYDSR